MSQHDELVPHSPVFEVGKAYMSLRGDVVEIVGETNVGNSYHCVFDAQGRHWYASRDYGRCTGAKPDDEHCLIPNMSQYDLGITRAQGMIEQFIREKNIELKKGSVVRTTTEAEIRVLTSLHSVLNYCKGNNVDPHATPVARLPEEYSQSELHSSL